MKNKYLRTHFFLFPFEGLNLFTKLTNIQSLPLSSLFGALIYIFQERPIKSIAKLFIVILMYYFFLQPIELLPFAKQSISVSIGIFYCFFVVKFHEKFNIKELNLILLTLPFVLLASFFDNYDSIFRLRGSFSEPAHLGDYLLMLLIPILLLNYDRLKKYAFYTAAIVLLIIAISTFSTLTIARFFILLFSLVVCFFNFQRLIILLALISSLVIIIFISPPNHIQYGFYRIYDVLSEGKLVYNFPSLVDRVYPIFYSIKSLFDGYIFGRGPGADWYFRHEVFDINYLNIILPYKKSTSLMNSFMGKMILYWGLIPIIGLGFWYYKILKVIDFNSNRDRLVLAISISTVLNSFFGIANFSLPYFWFWIGICSVYFLKKPTDNLGEINK